MPKELDHPRNALIDMQNIDDNECFKWCFVRYIHRTDHKPARITNADKGSAKRLDFKGIKPPLKTRDIHKIEKKTPNGISFFVVVKIGKNIQSMYQKMWRKTCWFIIDRRRQKVLCSYQRF